MSACEDFVQLELPKRPYLNTDVAEETVIVRRGAGPRQLGAVTLTNGQVLGMVGGTLQGVNLTSGPISAIKKHSQTFTAATTWTAVHNQSSTSFVAQVYDADGDQIIPDEIETTDANTITVRFTSATAGSIRVIFLE